MQNNKSSNTIFLLAFFRFSPYILLLSSISACTVAPLDGKEIVARNSVFPVVGFWVLPSSNLHIIAGPSSMGPWTVVDTVTTSRNPETYGSRQLYSFSTRVSVPSGAWRIPPAGCANGETYIGISAARAAPHTPAFVSFEEERLSGVNPLQCLQDNDFDASKCAGPRSPVSRILAGSQINLHTGNIHIRSISDYNTHRCVYRVNGNLRVDNTLPEIDFPELRLVTGNVQLDHPVRTPPDNPLALHSAHIVPRNMAQLRRVGGDFLINSFVTSPPPTTVGYTVRNMTLDLPLLTEVGGNVELIHIDPGGANGVFSGLNALVDIGGDLRFSSHVDRYIDALSNLRRLGGTFYAGTDRVQTKVLPELISIGGDLDMPRSRVQPDFLEKLTRVDGDARLGFHFDRVSSTPSSQHLPALESVGGSLILSESRRERFAIGSPSLSVGRLVIENNDRLIDFVTGSISVRGSGDVQFINNSLLCRSRIDAFISGLVAWSGVSTITGNDNGC